MTVYSDDPVAMARSFADAGARWVHVVDLSAAFGEDGPARAANLRTIRAICGIEGLSVDAGGGVRSLARIDELAAAGAARIALGTVLVTEPGFAEVAARGFGELLVADIAAREGQVKVNGWRDGVQREALDLVAELAALGFKHLVFTDIARDGMQTGIDRGRLPRHRPDRRLSRGRLGRYLDARRYPPARGRRRRRDRGRHHRPRALRGVLRAGGRAGGGGREGVAHARETRHPLPGRARRPRGEGRQLRRPARCGDPIGLASAYDRAGADEVVFLDITATSDNRATTIDMAAHAAAELAIPYTVGGGSAIWRACAPWWRRVPTRSR